MQFDDVGILSANAKAKHGMMRTRKKLSRQRGKLCDYSLAFAFVGVVLAVLEAELNVAGVAGFGKKEIWSRALRLLTLVSTIILMILIALYHKREIKIAAIDSDAESWRVVTTWNLIGHIVLELLICGICPFPWTGDITWPNIKPNYRSVVMTEVPLDVILSVGMFLRGYLLERFLVIHSKKFHDAATRSIATLNRVSVDFRFVLKTLMAEHPLTVLTIFALCFWFCAAWMIMQCDRYGMVPRTGEWEPQVYLNSLWLIAVTFTSIGYGNIVPTTYCGRTVAILTGIAGAGVSASLIAVIRLKLQLTRAEKHVNNFMSDCQLIREKKNAAASVLQQTWLIHKHKGHEDNRVEKMIIQLHQRKFLHAVNEFRRIKWDQMRLAEQGNDLIDIGQGQNELRDTALGLQRGQDQLTCRMHLLAQEVIQIEQYLLSQSNDIHKIREHVLLLQKATTGVLGADISSREETSEFDIADILEDIQ